MKKLVGIYLFALLTLSGCALPSLEGRSESVKLTQEEVQTTALGQAAAQAMTEHPGLTGVYPLSDSREAFAARIQLAKASQKTLDVQYYIWKRDTTGELLLDALREAADRGVRVRLLLDDHGIARLDDELFVLDSHPQIEVRLFNPFVFRAFKPLGFVTDFSRANRRMHNKSFTADNALTIVGGRNVGDEYFDATDGVLFADLDVMVLGPVVDGVSSAFDAYWASQSAYPIALMVKPPSAKDQKSIETRKALVERSEKAAIYKQAVAQLSFTEQFFQQQLPLEWAPAKLIVDDPSKGLGNAAPKEMITHHIERMMGQANQTLDLVSPYFVPTHEGTDYLVALAKQGVNIRILTNSMMASDVMVVHSGYAPHRKRLLEAGIQLFELKPDLTQPASQQYKAGFLTGSGSSLHAKTFGIDGKRIFIGTFNFDPRSAHLNTEMGFIFDSPSMKQRMSELFSTRIPELSWEVQLDPETNQLVWIDISKQPSLVLKTEPMTQWYQRAMVTFLSWLPIDWLL